MKKGLALLLSLALVICMIPATAVTAFADTAPVPLTDSMVVFSTSSSVLYNGANVAPKITVTPSASQTATENRDYTVSWNPTTSNGNLDAGTYAATVTAKEGSKVLTGSVTKNFVVEKVDFNKATLVYTGNTDTSFFTGFDKLKVGEKVEKITTTDVKVTQNGTEIANSLYSVNANKLSNTQIRVTATPVLRKPSVTGPVIYQDINLTTCLDDNYEIRGLGSNGTIPDQEYNGGNAIKPTIYVVAKTSTSTYNSLKEGTDYTVVYTDNTQGNKVATVTVKGINNYSGTLTKTFAIKGKDVSKLTISGQNTVQNQKPTFAVKDGNTTLTEGVDYQIVNYNSAAPGSNAGTAEIQGIGNYTGNRSASFNVIATGNTFGQNDVTFGTYTPSYNGSTQYATITVKLGNTILTKDRDYKVEYSYRDTKGNTVTTQYPKDARTYSVRVTGIGNYAGSATGGFTIVPVTLDWAEIVLGSSTVAYNGVYVPKVSVKHKYNNYYFPESDYEVTYRNVNSIYSSYLKPTAVVTVKEGGNLTTRGSSVQQLTKEFSIASRSLSNCTINFTDYRNSSAYTGSAIKPTVTVRDTSLNRILSLNSDYTVTYKDSTGRTVYSLTDTGVYSVIVTGAGAYSGSQTLTYTITGKDISSYTVTLKESSVAADGLTKVPVIVSVKNGYYNTLSSRDYTVSYQDSTGKTVTRMSAPGTYKVIVTGKNGYSGSCYAAFRIVGKSQTITGVDSTYKVYPTSETFKLTPSATEATGFTYVSSDPTVATVSAAGYVTPLKAGRAKITITTTGNRTYDPATYSTVIKVYPTKATMTKKPWNTGKKGQIQVRWNKQDNVTRYEVRYSRSKSFNKGTYLTKKVNPAYNTYSTQSTKISNLKSGYTYYVKVRAVKEVTNDYGKTLTYYGKWSNWKSVKVK